MENWIGDGVPEMWDFVGWGNRLVRHPISQTTRSVKTPCVLRVWGIGFITGLEVGILGTSELKVPSFCLIKFHHRHVMFMSYFSS